MGVDTVGRQIRQARAVRAQRRDACRGDARRRGRVAGPARLRPLRRPPPIRRLRQPDRLRRRGVAAGHGDGVGASAP